MLCCFATSDEDKEECTEQLVGLAMCLPYVGGNAKSPTPDCCSGLKQVLKVKKKCLSLLHLAPNSSDAQVFYQFGHGSNSSASSPIPSGK
ncbi:hypothetical protein RJ639_043263 [Escallonia herrerae]|uniref:Bifunctional inhibitor/plant lipid transfer protein/seed storage helical domain-containing protein n=1 Tax=Escallonia herrerae TaxID=1293975 RepID=A0AA88WD99_9ASTE|nr:hypothetical protein RJ639_043263 [Escallonia herrerae]